MGLPAGRPARRRPGAVRRNWLLGQAGSLVALAHGMRPRRLAILERVDGDMTRTWVALLYSIVLGPARRVRNDELAALADDLGYRRPRTLLASGNLIFEADAPDERAVEARLEPAFAARLGRPVDIIVRAGDRWPALVRGNPFPEAAAREPSRVAVRIMRDPAGPQVAERLAPYRDGGRGPRPGRRRHLGAPAERLGRLAPRFRDHPRPGRRRRHLPQLEHGAEDRRRGRGSHARGGLIFMNRFRIK